MSTTAVPATAAATAHPDPAPAIATESRTTRRTCRRPRRGRRISCPTLVLWSTRDDLAALYGDVLAVWEPWTTDLSGGLIDRGHHLAEEAPEPLATGSGTSSPPTDTAAGEPFGRRMQV